MSYDISIVDRKTRKTAKSSNPHNIMGGIYHIGCSQDLWLNITYNYGPLFRKAFAEYKTNDKQGIWVIDGQKVEDTVPILQIAINNLNTDKTDNYWDATEGNAREALENLLKLAKLCPKGDYIWEID